MSKEIMLEDVTVGSGILESYGRMPQKLERVFAEFIDNSTQSVKDHKKDLEAANESTICKIKITWNSDEIIIEDKAYGMDHDDFKRALQLNKPKSKYSDKSRSQYGMGLKIAAVYLGNWYSIESTQLGSTDRYYSVIDVEEWAENNPSSVENEVTEVSKDLHYTKIVIKKLKKKLTDAIDKKLRKNLATIYSTDLESGDLELTLNGLPIEISDPELWRNPEDDNEYLRSFEDSFEFNGEKFEYNGWVGILKTAKTDDAGFKLSQYGRGLILNYRPAEILGKPNSFPYQRIVGEILLDDKKWQVSFNKDEFIWDNGLEREFLISLKNNPAIKEMVSTATKLRKDNVTPIVKQEDAVKRNKELNKKYDNISRVTKISIEPLVDDRPQVKLDEEESIKANIVNVTWGGFNYSFDIQVLNGDPRKDWFTVQKKGDNNSYYIIVNGSSKYFAEYAKSKDLIIDFAITLALAQFSSDRLGLRLHESQIFIDQINNIIKNAEDEL